MTPRLHTLRTCGILLALAAPTLAASPLGTTSPYDGISYVARPAPDASRAGSPAGEGRERPGRRESAPPDEAASEEAASEEAVPAPVPTSVPDGPRDTDALSDTISGPVLRILPLGSGLVLIGSGLGLALLALRLRVRRT
ncbi:hypothetical protein GCM10023084_44590 [Streptomyces lacrimifluminis]|uniref:Uncharacterized protein n=1 Tax=Streptomyces lacrimifluminis TaxID=1500077 RepID=A0A917L754_9ACTN|nr:hypothetical protein [Streptomyces lacrimifluminis]GGJ45707.1 hypothetical protein GCM10012282_48250 [Streptomyces lacrimifluminis]